VVNFFFLGKEERPGRGFNQMREQQMKEQMAMAIERKSLKSRIESFLNFPEK
jgi:hypothetical protein